MTLEKINNPPSEMFIRFTPLRGRLFLSKDLRAVLGKRIDVFIDTQCLPKKIGIKAGDSYKIMGNEVQAVKWIYNFDIQSKERIPVVYDEESMMFVGEIPAKEKINE